MKKPNDHAEPTKVERLKKNKKNMIYTVWLSSQCLKSRLLMEHAKLTTYDHSLFT